ncbi:Pentapeptide repeat-containing protein [Filimonas lacunae]|uniref:Pentapeptide repeat-containing protein n=1 Tax=Filimonas lacunae TaxID=477680 RepID=A0A173M912_9BACT|nr:pentapeptide repeat-containing protein [Filimonas lacunae]BAV04026.1 hypothetical protein FLA_0004 [Filimonas lacunae]SIT16335.1 Pentapeptide repeat-containing protein [Filimonas lacunae]
MSTSASTNHNKENSRPLFTHAIAHKLPLNKSYANEQVHRINITGKQMDSLIFEVMTFEALRFMNNSCAGAYFTGCHFANIIFSHCHLRKAEFTDCTFENVVLENCSLDHADFNNSKLEQVSFHFCTMEWFYTTDSKWHNIRIQQCLLDGAVITDSELQNIAFRKNELERHYPFKVSDSIMLLSHEQINLPDTATFLSYVMK